MALAGTSRRRARERRADSRPRHGIIDGDMDLIDDLSARGLIHDSTDLEFLRSRLDERSVGVYVGFDPTADSLHAGHLLGQLGLRRFQMAGHRPFPLAGGATGMIGDPGGKSEERNLLSREELAHNVSRIKLQLQRILDFEPGPYQATLVDNADWTAGTSLLDFLRDVGKHITVNQMMAKESVKARLVRRRRHLLHRVQLHAAPGQRLPAPARALRRRDPDGRLRPVGQHHRRHRPDPQDHRRRRPRPDLAAPAPQPTAASSARPRAARCGSIPSARRRTSSASSGSRLPTTRSPSTCCGSRPARSRTCTRRSPSTSRRPSGASGSGRWRTS